MDAQLCAGVARTYEYVRRPGNRLHAILRKICVSTDHTAGSPLALDATANANSDQFPLYLDLEGSHAHSAIVSWNQSPLVKMTKQATVSLGKKPVTAFSHCWSSTVLCQYGRSLKRPVLSGIVFTVHFLRFTSRRKAFHAAARP